MAILSGEFILTNNIDETIINYNNDETINLKSHNKYKISMLQH